MKKYIYAIVDEKISCAQVLVQLNHGFLEIGKRFYDNMEHPSVVLLRGKGDDVHKFIQLANKNNIHVNLFCDDLFNNVPKICITQPIDKELGFLFKKFRLFNLNLDVEQSLINRKKIVTKFLNKHKMTKKDLSNKFGFELKELFQWENDLNCVFDFTNIFKEDSNV